MTDPQRFTFGAQLRRLRLAAGLTQESLAERSGLSARALSDLERNPDRLPRLETVNLLADGLGLDPERRVDLLAAARPDNIEELPRQTTTAGSSGVPRPLTRLIGRAGVAAAVAELVRRGDTQLVTLTGPGGVGKTRLAIEVTRLVADQFPDGVHFVDLAPLRDSALVLSTLAQQWDLDERGPAPLPERLRAALQGKRALVVLDNFEHVVAAAIDLVGVLEACPQLMFLATSRVPLRVRGEREHRIAPLELPSGATDIRLPPPAAVVLFMERAAATGTSLRLDTTTAPIIAEICRRLDGLPLAIELAAVRARLLPPSVLLTRLEQRLPLLSGGPHDLPARQRTMRDTVAWSYALLTDHEQHLFRQLCVFDGGCTLAAAEAVCGQDADGEHTVIDGLTGLVDNSLLYVRNPDGDEEQTRVIALETIREFGLEQLHAQDEADDVQRRHAMYYLQLAESAEPHLAGRDALTWVHRLERDHDNLRAALRWTHDHDVVTALRLTGALWRFWSERGHHSEGSQWLARSLNLPHVDDSTVTLRIKARIGAGRLALDRGLYDQATIHSDQAADLAQAGGDTRDLVAALNVQGKLAWLQDRYSDAAHHYDEALNLAQGADDVAGAAEALTGLALVALVTGQPERAIRLGEQSVTLLRDLGSDRDTAEALLGFSASNYHIGRYDEAAARCDEALALFRSLGDAGKTAEALRFRGMIAHENADYDHAAALYEESLTLRRARGDEAGVAQLLGHLGAVALNRGNHELAEDLLQECLVTAHRRGERWGAAITLTLLGHLALARDEPERATGLLGESAELLEAIGNPLYMSWCLEGLAGVAVHLLHYQQAAELLAVRDIQMAEVHSALAPAHPAAHARTATAIRLEIGEEGITAARASAQLKSVKQVISETLANAREQ